MKEKAVIWAAFAAILIFCAFLLLGKGRFLFSVINAPVKGKKKYDDKRLCRSLSASLFCVCALLFSYLHFGETPEIRLAFTISLPFSAALFIVLLKTACKNKQ